VATTQETHHNDATTSWSVQVGSFPDVESATKRVAGLKDKGHDAYHLAVRIRGKTWYQVRIGHFASRAEANMLHDRLKTSDDFKRSFVTSRRG
jgi:cell division protein FtsN